PHELHLEVKAERGAKYPCPVCGQACSAHDFQEKTWRHWNFFQHHCYIHASVLRVKCQEHGVKRVEVPWARKGSAFRLLFEQAALALVREMSVNAAARFIEITDKRLWRIVEHYVGKAVSPFNLSDIEPVVFATPGKGKQPLKQFSAFLDAHEGDPANIREAVFDMS
ncbi:helix-turn-helix domain-containing protein, partial [Thiolapillus sp.]